MFQVCPVPPHSNASYTGNDILKHLAARTDMLKYVYKESNLWNSFNLKFKKNPLITVTLIKLQKENPIMLVVSSDLYQCLTF